MDLEQIVGKVEHYVFDIDTRFNILIDKKYRTKVE